jgi:hypothetical protein
MGLKWKAIGVLLVVVLGGLAEAPATAQTTPLFRMDCGTNGSNWPQCGFDYVETRREGVYWRRTLVPAGSPSGSDAAQYDWIPTSDTQLDFGYGWAYNLTQPVPQGATRYIRYRIKILSPLNAATASDSRWASKLVILGNTCESGTLMPTRVISELGTPGGYVWNVAQWRLAQNIDWGGPSGMTVNPIRLDTWHDVQIKVQSSTTTSSSDGMLYIYIDGANSSEGTPTAQSASGFTLKTLGWSTTTCPGSHLVFGGSAREIANGSRLSFQVADFEYDSRFDSRWSISGSSGGASTPAAPTGLRIVSGAAIGVLPISALLSILGYRVRRSKLTTARSEES